VSSLEERLIGILNGAGARYRVIDHEPEGETVVVSLLRGHEPHAAAKCIVLMVKIGKHETRHVLAVVPGDTRVDLDAVKGLLGGTYISFASRDRAEELAGSESGTVLPYTFDPRLELIADPALLGLPEIFFNVARLDRSLALNTSDWQRTAQPRLERIAQP
jgi:Ala-tRNA(Pro) deacylase